jgi:DnaK suppressor protein
LTLVNATPECECHDQSKENDMTRTPPSASPAGWHAQLEAALRARRTALVQQSQAHLEGNSRVDHAREQLLQDGHDATQRDADREVDFARTDRDAVALAEIDAALLRLANGQYGLCIDCGDEIAPARLQLAPESSRCIACASQQERAHGQGKPPTM